MIKCVVSQGSWLKGRRKWRWLTLCFTQSGSSAPLVLTFVLMYHCEEWVRMKECVGNFAAWAALSLNTHTHSRLNIAPPHLGQATQRQGDGAGWHSVTGYLKKKKKKCSHCVKEVQQKIKFQNVRDSCKDKMRARWSKISTNTAMSTISTMHQKQKILVHALKRW